LRAAQDGESRLGASLFARLWFPLLVLAIGLVVSASFAHVMRESVNQEEEDNFDLQAEQAKNAIAARIQSYSDALYAVRALFHTSSNVTQRNFRDFVGRLELETRYPALRNLNYAAYVPEAERDKLIAQIRGDPTGGPAARAFSIRPPGSRPFYYVITHLAPFEGNERSFGLDIGAPPFWTDALEYGRDSGLLVSSGRIIRFEDGAANIALRIAVYRSGEPTQTVEQRRAAYVGSVGAGFRVADLMRGVLEAHNLHHIAFSVLDVERTSGDKQLVFQNALAREARPSGEAAAMYVTRREIEMAGRLWELEFQAPQASLGSYHDRQLPWVVFVCGVLLSLLLASILFFITSSRQRAVVLARRINRDLHAKEAGLAEAQRMARLGSWEISGHKRQMVWSQELYRVLGMEPHGRRVLLDDFLQAVHPADRQKVRDMLRLSSEPGAVLELEHRLLLRDGSERWVISKAKLEEPLSEGGVWRGTTMDITERKQAEFHLQTEHQVTRLLASGRQAERVLGELLQTLTVRLNMACAVYWAAEERQPLRCARVSCIDTIDRGSRVHLQMENAGSPLAALAAQKRQVVLAADLPAAAPPVQVGASGRVALHSAAAFPVVAANRVRGAIELFAERRIPLDGSVADLLCSIGAHVGQYLEKALAEEALESISAHDPVTGLPNRLEFENRLSLALKRARRHRSPIAIVLLGFQHFERLIESAGPGGADRLLGECARRIAASLRASDTVARAGSGFLVMIEGGEAPHQVAALARKLLDAVGRPFMVDGRSFTLSACAGISRYPEDGLDPATLLKHADAAMFHAKEDAAGGCRFFARSANEAMEKRGLAEAELRRALERKEFALHYQPQASLADGCLAGVEALLRWQHPERGLLEAADFLQLAEEHGLSASLDRWVLQQACEHARAWQRKGFAPRVALNVSSARLAEQGLADDVAGALQAARLAPQSLQLQVPEHALERHSAGAAQALQELKARGVGLVLDGFGIGCAPLSQLRMFPFDAVNIDRSVVAGIPADSQETALVESMVHLAHALGMRAAAVGVESAEQLQRLERLGCEEVQGHFVARPAPHEALVPLVDGRIRLVQHA
jgi:diguanylate cyclase (GGDEF)-like protein